MAANRETTPRDARSPGSPSSHEAVYTYRFPSILDADAVRKSLDVERGDRIPNVAAKVVPGDEAGEVLRVVLTSPDVGDLRAATKSYLTRIQAAVRVLEAARGPTSAR